MNDVIAFFKGLFATDLWPARWFCGHWTSFHGWLYILSDLTIWVSYFLIPIIIIDYFSKRRQTLKFQKVYFLFAAFILLCGATHFLDALMFWVPIYRFNALIRFFTAIVSMMTVFYLIKILPAAFKQKTSLELEREIAMREMAERKLEEANKGLKAFAYVASHDLQEPLRKIRIFASMLNEHNEEKFDEKSKDLATKIVSSTAKMQHLVEDVLSLSSISELNDMAMVELSDIITSAKDSLEVKIAERNVVINVGNLPPVLGNSAYLGQLFVNLLSNSIKFSKQQPVISINGHLANNKVIINITDNGIGMKPGDTTRIFDAFQRLNSKHDYEGSGIGLAICKKIVDVHNGTITVNSQPDVGTTFTIELPAAT